MRCVRILIAMLMIAGVAWGHRLDAQSSAAMTRLKPLGAPSAVDQFQGNRPPAMAQVAATDQPVTRNETAFWQTSESTAPSSSGVVRQTVWMQSELSAPPLGGSGMALPGVGPSASPVPNGGAFPNGASTPVPGATPFPGGSAPVAPLPQRSLPPPPAAGTQLIPSPSDQTPVPQPQLDANSFARVDNCNLVTPPSSYVAAMGTGCGQVVPTTYASPVGVQTGPPPSSLPAEIPSVATTPPVTVLPPAPQAMVYPNTTAPARALISFGQERNAVQVGQGLVGQPVAYVPGQRFRNWLRYIFP